ncbi:MAG: acyltransferase family protein [Flavobacterium sp.]
MFGLAIDLNKRIHGLDIARSIAISLVVFSHSLWISNFFPPLVSWFMQLSGTIGVEIFFVISGFLIGKIVLRMLENEDFSFSTIMVFLKRRWFRTLPNYYLILFVNVLLWYFIYNDIPDKLYLYFVYLQNLTQTSPDFYRISWSLAVEQFCYIIGPFTLLFLVKIFPRVNRRHLFLGMSLFMIALFFGTRFFFNATHELTSLTDWNQSLRKVTIYRLDAIYYGFVLFYLYSRNHIAAEWNLKFFLIGLFGVFTLHVLIFVLGIQAENYPLFFNIFYLPLNSIAICLTIPFLISIKLKESFFLKWVTLLSVISYSIYLLHYTVILHTMKVLFPSENLKGFALFGYTFFYWVLVIFLSYLLYRFFEKPMTNLREKK